MTKSVDHAVRAEAGAGGFCGPHFFTVAVLSVATALLFADQNLMAPNLTAIGNEFGFDEQQRDKMLGGDIAVAFFMVGGVASLGVGYLTDRPDLTSRRDLYALVVLLGEGATVLTYFVTAYWQLVVLRALTGLSVGGALPVVFSMCGDLFPPNQRARASALIGAAMGCGVMFGQLVAGLVGPVYGWRAPFAAVGLPAMACACVLRACTPEPVRGGSEPARTDPAAADAAVSESAALLDKLDKSKTSDRSESAYQAQAPQSNSSAVDKAAARGRPGVNIMVLEETAVASEASALPRRRTEKRAWGGAGDRAGEQAAPAHRGGDAAAAAAAAAAATTGSIGGSSAAPRSQSTLAKLRVLLTTPTVVLVYLQGIPGCVPWGVVNVYLNDYMAQQRGLTVPQATSLLVLFGLGSVIGGLVGGAWGQCLYNRDKRFQPLLMGLSTGLGAAPLVWLINAPAQTMALYAPCFFLTGLVVSITGANVRAVLLNVTAPEVRGVAFSVFNLMDDVGKGLGPAVVSAFIAAHGRQKTFSYAVLPWVLCGALLCAMAFTVRRDEARVQDGVRLSLVRR
eukprot:g2539.t1